MDVYYRIQQPSSANDTRQDILSKEMSFRRAIKRWADIWARDYSGKFYTQDGELIALHFENHPGSAWKSVPRTKDGYRPYLRSYEWQERWSRVTTNAGVTHQDVNQALFGVHGTSKTRIVQGQEHAYLVADASLMSLPGFTPADGLIECTVQDFIQDFVPSEPSASEA